MDEDELRYCHHDDTDEYHDCLDYMECEECPYYYEDLDQEVRMMKRLVEELYTFKGKVEDCENDYIIAVQEKLREYEDLEEQGLLLRLPCGIGTDIYFVPSKTNFKLNILQSYSESNRVYHQTVERITFTKNGWYLECDKDLEYATDHILIDKLYKETWFLSQAEAEQKLKEMESD